RAASRSRRWRRARRRRSSARRSTPPSASRPIRAAGSPSGSDFPQALHRAVPDRLPAGVRVQDTLPFRYRGMLEVDLEICTACLACERACPIDCIVIDATKDKAAGGLVMTRFDIDMAKCMYCGLCSEPCPTGSIHHTPEFEGADYSLESMVRKFVKAPVLAYKPKKGGETDPEIAPILERGMRYIEEFASPEGGGT